MENRLFRLIREGKAVEVKQIVESNSSTINSRDERGSTPLILAAYYNQKQIVLDLLELGAAIDLKDASGNTALMGVCFKGYTDLVEVLIKNGAHINDQNTMGVLA